MRTKRAGFTLVELLVVIGIIALLISILLPSLAKAREASNRTKCLANLKSLGMAWYQYANDNHGQLVGAGTDAADVNGLSDSWVGSGNDPKVTVQSGQLWPYTNSLAIYVCPSEGAGYVHSFSINNYFNGTANPPQIQKMQQVTHASETFVFVEEFDLRNGDLGSFVIAQTGDVWEDYPANYHKGGSCLGFADLHSEYWSYSDSRTGKINAHYANTPNNADLVRFQAALGYW